jgi:hypothetical protein
MFAEVANNLLCTDMPKEFDTRPAEVTTFIPKLYPELTNDLNKYSSTLKNKDSHRLLENYIDINFNQFPFVTMLKKHGTIVGFSTGYTRDVYPSQCVRILNRYYQDSENLRVNFTREILRPTTFAIVEQQLEMSRRLNYDTAIITREPRTHKFFTSFVNALSSKSSQKWELRKGPYLLTPSYNNHKAWQSIAYTKFKDTKEDFWQHWRTK